MEDWLSKKRVYFDTIGHLFPSLIAIVIAIAALVVAIRDHATQQGLAAAQHNQAAAQQHQTDIQKSQLALTARPSLYLAYNSSNPSELEIDNSGAPITNLSIQAFPAFDVICTSDKKLVLPVRMDSTLSAGQGTTGDLATITWPGIGSSLDQLAASATQEVADAQLITFAHYAAISYRNILGHLSRFYGHRSWMGLERITSSQWADISNDPTLPTLNQPDFDDYVGKLCGS